MARKQSISVEQPRLSATEIAETFHKTVALVEHGSRCGKANCKCATTGYRHGPYAFLRWRDRNGQQRRRYVPKAEVARVREILALRQLIDRERRQALAEARDYLRYLRQLRKEYRLW